MTEYVSEAITTAMPVLKMMVQEHIEATTEKKAKKQLTEKAEDLPEMSPFLFCVQALCLLLGEDFYLKEQDVSNVYIQCY